MDKYLELSNKYDTFIYDSYKVYYEDNKLKVDYHYVIKNLEDFNTTLEIDESEIKNKNIDSNMLEYLAFHIGLVELLSYWKCVCSKNIIINCGYLNDKQINWFRKLYYNGLGEFFYVNNIEVSMDSFVNIKCTGSKLELNNNYNGVGNLITIGGGKDSIVACELLRSLYDENTCFSLNPKSVHIDSIDALGYHDKKIFVRKTYVDKKLIELNKQGYLNGHTPFSSLLAFISYFTAYLTGRKYIVLSNEASANQATVMGTNINHQYSKTYEFECYFNDYTKKYFNIDIKYFRYKDKLVNIFGSDLYEDEELLNTFIELVGYSDKKPFECVGTFEEARYAVSMLINKLDGKLPYLLKYYKDNYPLYEDKNILYGINDENNIDDKFMNIVREELDRCRKKYLEN